MAAPSQRAAGRGPRLLLGVLDGTTAVDVTSVAGLLFGADAVRGRLIAEFRSLLGETGSKAVEAILAGASSPQSGRVAAAVGLVLLLVAAVGVVAQLKDALDTIWNVEDPRDASWGWYARTYIVSFAGVLALGFLLAVSLVISTGLAAITSLLGVSTEDALGLEAANFIVSLALLTALFAMLFKWFPDTDIAWRDVWFGAVLTALVFNLGKLVIGWYVGTHGPELDLWRRGFDRRLDAVGLPHGADRPVRRGSHARLRNRARLSPRQLPRCALHTQSRLEPVGASLAPSERALVIPAVQGRPASGATP